MKYKVSGAGRLNVGGRVQMEFEFDSAFDIDEYRDRVLDKAFDEFRRRGYMSSDIYDIKKLEV